MDFKKLKKLSLTGAAAVFLFAACSNDTVVVGGENPLGGDLEGMWWGVIDSVGTYVSGNKTLEYTRIGHAIRFNEDGSGSAVTLFFDDNSNEPINLVGGKNFAPLTYSTTPNGSISTSFDNAYPYYADYYKSWILNYADSCINVNDGKHKFKLEHASNAMAAVIQEWDYMANGGAAAASNYNINDEDFTADKWREQDAIYIWDGQTRITDKNRKDPDSYMLVNLPWYEGEKQTNLPHKFTDDLTPEKGWEWVLNRCGSTVIPNNNFFAVYNKYTGILRFFYYLPSGVTTGNDHVWQISMSDSLALHSLFGYGLPSREKVKNKSLLGPTGNGTMINYVAPWVEVKSDDGMIVPKDGWWAFDVDLSLYRPSSDQSKDIISLLMRSWNTQHVSLHSTMQASINGSLKQKVKEAETSGSDVAKGVLTAGAAALNIAGGIAFFKAGGAENIANGLGALANVLGCGSEFAGIFGEKDEPFEAEISLGLDGTIDTEGFIKGASTNIGVASPTLYMRDFIHKNSPTLGQGVWNIKKHPVVYVFKDIKYAGMDTETYPGFIFACFPYFFDPSSIEVELNPEVFPEKQIEWIQVDATCVGTQQMGVTGTDRYRLAFGLSTTYRGKSAANIMTMSYGRLKDHLATTGDVFDFVNSARIFNYGDVKMEYLTFVYGNVKGGSGQLLYGRGYENGYAIEPMLLNGIGSGILVGDMLTRATDIYVPALEVNVIVSVKMKGSAEPFVFSRNYLPKLNDISLSEVDGIYSKIKKHELGSKQKGHDHSYKYQLKHLDNMFNWLQHTFVKENCNPICGNK